MDETLLFPLTQLSDDDGHVTSLPQLSSLSSSLCAVAPTLNDGLHVTTTAAPPTSEMEETAAPVEAGDLTPDLEYCGHVVDCNNCHAAPGNCSSSNRQLLAGMNNSSQEQHMKYLCPAMPEPACDIGEPNHVTQRVAYRMGLRPDRHKYVSLNFRVMRYDADIHVGMIINQGGIKRSALYTPRILDRWTHNLRIKIKSMVKVSLVFKSISARLGLQSTVGIKYCLDGFYGVEAFGDAFGNIGTGICPWMEVTGDGTPLSLKLEDNDNIYISVATEKMLELARLRAQQISEQQFKQSQQRSQRPSKLSVTSLRFEDHGNRGSEALEMEHMPPFE